MSLLDAIEKLLKKIDEDVATLLKLGPTKTIKTILEDIKTLNQDNLNKLIEIYTAMSFQDITAQQIKKYSSNRRYKEKTSSNGGKLYRSQRKG